MKHKKSTAFSILRSELFSSEFKTAALLGILTIAAGAVFYRFVELWSWSDAIYFSISTLTTVGIGGISPHTEAGKVFTSLYMLIGVGIMFGFISMVAKRANQLRFNAEVDVHAVACEKCGK